MDLSSIKGLDLPLLIPNEAQYRASTLSLERLNDQLPGIWSRLDFQRHVIPELLFPGICHYWPPWHLNLAKSCYTFTE